MSDILSQILRSGLGGQAGTQNPRSDGGPPGQGGLGGLLGGAGGGMAGGLGGLLGGGMATGALGGLLRGGGGGGGMRTAMLALVYFLMNRSGGSGGLGALVERLRGSGLGPQVDSWVSNGPNQNVAPEELNRALGDAPLDEWGRETGLGRDGLLGALSQFLPDLVNRATPNGHLPSNDDELPRDELGGLLRGLGGLGAGQGPSREV